jgi:perosamine synthetase
MFEDFVALVRGIYGTDGPVPLHRPVLGEREKACLCEAVDSSFVSSVGPEVDEFERRVADYTGCGHAVATVNGTAALHTALLLAGVRPEDEVITQALSFVATANAIRYCGAWPVFLDIEEKTLGLSPDALRHFLETRTELCGTERFDRITGRRIGACLPMHTLGHPARIDDLAEICRTHGLPLVEDAAEALGSWYQGRHAGTFGRLGVLSFNGNKIVTTGGGGMVLCDDPVLARRAKHLTTTAKSSHPWQYRHDEIGFNYRLPNLNAALGCAQMEQLPRFLESKRRVAERYAAWCAQRGIRSIGEPPATRSNFWLNGFWLDSESARDAFLSYTNNAGIMTRPLWVPLHRLPMYEACPREDLGVTELAASRIVNVPSSALP